MLTICNFGDTDCDGMNDQWELDHFGSLDNDGTGDTDGDGISDLDEFLDGTDPTVAVEVTLKAGYNMIAVTEDPSHQRTLGEWHERLGGSGYIEKLGAFNPTAGSIVEFEPGSTANEDYTLLGGEGIIVYAAQDHRFFFADKVCVDIDLRAGINLVGLVCAPDGYTAFDLLERLGMENAASIQRYDTVTGGFQTVGYSEYGQLNGENFTIVTGEAYFLQMHNAVIDFIFDLNVSQK